MSVCFYWGDDEFAIAQAIKQLKTAILDPTWESFNFEKIGPDVPNALNQALNQALTPPFGSGKRLIWLADTPVGQRCPPEQLSELERTLPSLPDTSVLLFTSTSKPDGRLKSTKVLEKYGTVQEFSLVPSWNTEAMLKQVRQRSQTLGLSLTAAAMDTLVDTVGNDTRQLQSELDKLWLYANSLGRSLDVADIERLVTATNQSALKLGEAIRLGQTARSLELVTELLQQNEPALRIVSALVSQFRTWTWVKLMIQSGERDNTVIAKAAELKNPKRIYFLRQEVQPLSLSALLATLPLLLELEANLKRGADDLQTLQIKVIELCALHQPK